MDNLAALTPSLIAIATSTINHVYRDGRPLEVRDMMLFLSPSIPQIIPIFMRLLIAFLRALTDFLTNLVRPRETAPDGTQTPEKEFKDGTSNLQLGASTGPGTRWLAWWPVHWQWLWGWTANAEEPNEHVSESSPFIEPEPRMCLNVECDMIFVQLLVWHILSSPNTCTYMVDTSNQSMSIVNRTECKETTTWTNISIRHEDIRLSLGELKLTYVVRNGRPMLSYFGAVSYNPATPQSETPRDMTTFTDILDFFDPNDPLIKYGNIAEFTNITNILQNYYPSMCPLCSSTVFFELARLAPSGGLIRKQYPHKQAYIFALNCMANIIQQCNDNPDKSTYIYIPMLWSIIKCKYTQIGKYKLTSPWNICLLDSYAVYESYVRRETQGISIQRNKNKFTFTSKNKTDTIEFSDQFMDILQYSKYNTCESAHKAFTPPFTEDELKAATSSASGAATTATSTSLPFVVRGTSDTAQVKKFFQTLQSASTNVDLIVTSQTNRAKVAIYHATLERTPVRRTTPNPDYVAYEEKRTLLTSLTDATAATLALNEFMKQIIPPKELVEIDLDVKVVAKQVNEKYKDLDTTYLRENDMNRLRYFLTKFRNGGELYEKYGLPNKLGVLLHGLPGTGKTTTIHAIASFLQKPIYYVALSAIESNEELQLIFDHVVQKSDSGGIIVFEDIDAMTPIVLSRETVGAAAATATTSAAPPPRLTLEYFLNLLQGSLTRDGTIFIATTNHYNRLDSALTRIGRFDVVIEMKRCDHYQISRIFETFIGRPISTAALHRIPENTFTPAQIIFHIANHLQSPDTDDVIMAPFLSPLSS